MSSQRQMRKDLQKSQKNPINVSIFSEDGGRRILTWKEYLVWLKANDQVILNREEEDGLP